MIKINLLGKRKKLQGAVPFGLDEHLEKLGIRFDDLERLKPKLTMFGAMLALAYIAYFIPNYLHQEKMAALDMQLSSLETRLEELRKELASKREIRKNMEQLSKEEGEMQRQLNAVSALKKDRSLAFRSLNDLVVALPEKVWFATVFYAERVIRLTGKSWEYFPINDFVKYVNSSTFYHSVVFKGISTEDPTQKVPGVPDAKQKIKRFEVDFKVRGSGDK
ncbi:MAG: PilN domain-containing protein [Oligoflexia bacterium]|nr:PilN domain-containing protein [Oligoflexia bacterium]